MFSRVWLPWITTTDVYCLLGAWLKAQLPAPARSLACIVLSHLTLPDDVAPYAGTLGCRYRGTCLDD